MTHPQHIYVQPAVEIGVTVPALVCHRFATNQVGLPPDQGGPLQEFVVTAGVSVWTGDESGATGVHQQYLYVETDTPGVHQQYLVVSDYQTGSGGDFIAGEALSVT